MSELPVWLAANADGLSLRLYVQPGAKRTAVTGEHGERLKIAVAAPARESQANDALLAFLARRLGLQRSALTLAAGETSRSKRVHIAVAIDPADIVAALSK